jgi:molybdenum cofactor guanylyltransferase
MILSLKKLSLLKKQEEKVIISVNSSLYGLILIGGKSARMYKDKSTLQYHGHNQRDHLLHLLSPFCAEVFFSCNASQAAELDGKYNFLQDRIKQIGPMGGIHAALKQFTTVGWLVVACDLPLLTTETLSYLISHREPHRQATGFRNRENGFHEPLLTIYEPSAYPVIARMIENREYSPSHALSNMDVAWLEVPNMNDLKNINDPEGYRRTLEEIRSPLK